MAFTYISTTANTYNLQTSLPSYITLSIQSQPYLQPNAMITVVDCLWSRLSQRSAWILQITANHHKLSQINCKSLPEYCKSPQITANQLQITENKTKWLQINDKCNKKPVWTGV